MAKAAAKQTPNEILEQIQSHMQELRQSEALETQMHEMVVAKRHRLDALMSQFLETAAEVPAPPARVIEDLPLAQVLGAGAPRDLLNQSQSAPSAQQVLDSLNRLMSGLKEISTKQGVA